MSFANPLGWLGLLAVPAISILHLYYRRFPPLLIGGLHLWGVQTQVREAGRRRERLPITASLLLELLAAAVLSLVLAEPGWAESRPRRTRDRCVGQLGVDAGPSAGTKVVSRRGRRGNCPPLPKAAVR